MNNVLDALLTLFSSAFGSTFKGYFKGRQKVPAMSDLPILMLYPIRTEQTNSGTLRDLATYTIGAKIVINLRTYFDSENGQGNQIDSLDALIELIESRDAEGVLQDDTVMGVVRQNNKLGNTVLFNKELEVEYEDYLTEFESQYAQATLILKAEDRPNRLNS